MRAINIEWDVDIKDAMEQLDGLTVEEANEILKTAFHKKEDQEIYVHGFYKPHLYPKFIAEFMQLPTSVKVPENLKDKDSISDWLTYTYGFCHKGFELEEEKDYVLIIERNYYAGQNEKYWDMWNVSGSGPIGAKKLTLEEAYKLKESFRKNGFDNVYVERYDPNKYLQKELEDIQKYEDRRKAQGIDPGYAIINSVRHALKYLKEVKEQE